MTKTRFEKESNPEKDEKRFSKFTVLIVLGVIAVAAAGFGMFLSKYPNTVKAQSRAVYNAPDGKRYVATKNIVVDKDTGQARRPNDQELKQLVENLTVLTRRSDENLTSVAGVNGGVSMDLDGGFAGTVLARPNPDGTMETKCVFTFEEAAEFLGVVVDNLN